MYACISNTMSVSVDDMPQNAETTTTLPQAEIVPVEGEVVEEEEVLDEDDDMSDEEEEEADDENDEDYEEEEEEDEEDDEEQEESDDDDDVCSESDEYWGFVEEHMAFLKKFFPDSGAKKRKLMSDIIWDAMRDDSL